MTGFDTAGALRSRMDDPAAVWEFLRLFAAAWGVPAARVHPVDGMPPALRDAILPGPRRPSTEDGVLLFHWSDPLVTDTSWGIPLDAVDEPDPPVVMDTGSGWRPYTDRLSLACVDFALTAAIDQDGTPTNACELPPERAVEAMARFDRVPLPDLPMWVEVEDSPVRWYSRPGQLVRAHGDGWIWAWVRGRTPADLESIYEAIPMVRWSQ